MSVVDSSGWIEYFEDGPNAAAFAPEVEDIEHLLVPTLVVTEVSRWLRVHGRSALVDELLAVMARGHVADHDLPTAGLQITFWPRGGRKHLPESRGESAGALLHGLCHVPAHFGEFGAGRLAVFTVDDARANAVVAHEHHVVDCRLQRFAGGGSSR